MPHNSVLSAAKRLRGLSAFLRIQRGGGDFDDKSDPLIILVTRKHFIKILNYASELLENIKEISLAVMFQLKLINLEMQPITYYCVTCRVRVKYDMSVSLILKTISSFGILMTTSICYHHFKKNNMCGGLLEMGGCQSLNIVDRIFNTFWSRRFRITREY